MAGELCCVLTQPDLGCTQLESVGFLRVVTSAEFTPDFWAAQPDEPEARAVLIAQVGLGIDVKTMEVLCALSKNANAPSILVVVIAQIDHIMRTSASNDEFADTQHQVQEAFIAGGADDVVFLDASERISGHRVLEAIHRIEILARKLSQEIDSIQQQAAKKVEDVKEMASKKLQVAWKNQMWTFPGAVLESIPTEDPSITEWAAKDKGILGGVGAYAFEARLGGGSFGTVFKAYHSERGTVAVKVIQKNSVKNASQLFSLNQELCIMQHMPSHANVTGAFHAFHTSNCIYLVMDYAGGMSLHKFVRATLAADGHSTLPRDLARSFCVQMAVALSHLHGLMVCHRDLKPANFIVSDTGNLLRLVDFGFAVMLCSKEQRLTACCGSLPFCAPEVLRAGSSDRSYDPFAADVWSLSLNFVEMACGPYSIEKCLGWVPQHPVDSDQRKRDIERLESLWASTPDTGIKGLGNTVSRMLVLNPERRWKIHQVLGQEGFGVGLTASPPSRRGRVIKVRNDPAPPPAASERSLEVDRPGSVTSGGSSLLERLGGVGTIREAIEKMFDTAINSTLVYVSLRRNAASIPSLRAMYLEEVAAFFDTVPGSEKETSVLDRFGDSLRPWDFSDAVFDTMVAQFAVALDSTGVPASVAQEAVARFQSLRVKVTAGYRAGAAFARKRNTAAWRSKVAADAECPKRIAVFAETLVRILSEHRSLGPGLPPVLRDCEGIKTRVRKYFQNDAKVLSPVPLLGLSLSLDELVEIMDCARQALVEANWGPDEVLLLDFAMSAEWDQVRLARALDELATAAWKADRVAWTNFMLRLQMAFVASPENRSLSENPVLPMCFARVCEVLATRSCEDPWQLCFSSYELGFSDGHFDALIGLTPGACTDLQPAAAGKVAEALQAMRAWVVQGSTKTARAG